MNTLPQTKQMSIAQKAIATTTDRGATLLTKDGYRIFPIADLPGRYIVARSENDTRPLRKGECDHYTVDIINQDCNCPQYEFRGTCKHIIGATEKIAECARLMGPMLPVAAPVSRVVEQVEAASERTLPKRGTDAYRKMVAQDFC